MYFQALKALLAGVQAASEDLWMDKQCCRNIIIDSGLMTEDTLEASVAASRSLQANREMVKEHFADLWNKLDELGKQAAYELQLLETPPTDKPN